MNDSKMGPVRQNPIQQITLTTCHIFQRRERPGFWGWKVGVLDCNQGAGATRLYSSAEGDVPPLRATTPSTR